MNTVMHITREQATVMLGAVVMRRRLVEEVPDIIYADAPVDPAQDLARLKGAERMLVAALERIQDRENRHARRGVWAK